MANTPSLRGTLTRRLLLALLSLGGCGALFTYLLTNNYANLAYDRALFDSAVSLAQQVSYSSGDIRLDLPPQARSMLLNDQSDTIVYRAIDLHTGRILDQNADLGPWSADPAHVNQPVYRDAITAAGLLRVVSLEQVLPNGNRVLIEVGETRHKRELLTREILIALAALLITMVTMTIALVWRGTERALAPLHALEAEAASRSMQNLSPLNEAGAPREVRGLIEAINRLMARLEESVELQRRFTANAAHQLRTPLAGLRLQAQLALKADETFTKQQALRDIESNASRTSHIVDQLLTLARAEVAPGVVDHAQQIDLVEIALQVIARHVSLALDRGIDLGFEGDHTAAWISGNPSLLEELIANLVDNAIRYTPRQSSVTVEIERKEKRFDLLVTDNGAGIPPEEREQVFRRFYRSDTAPEGGAGLGLAIVREIAERHQATVVIEDGPDGIGCRFRISFPKLAHPGP
ncbi:MAG: sensor histidine kinase N-terminal domain-containing protein [Burkholderiales bacterium]|nr:sensor histidine kinase N-terminal domain-containing protein [Burkholderiales bacterium]